MVVVVVEGEEDGRRTDAVAAMVMPAGLYGGCVPVVKSYLPTYLAGVWTRYEQLYARE